jgi:hypothetical protein
LGWIIGVLLPLGAAAFLVGFRWNAVRLTRKVAAPDSPPTAQPARGAVFVSAVTACRIR